jgi:hypothetical protein
MKCSTLNSIVIAGFLLLSHPNAFATVFEYDWTGHKPGYSGKIFLDAPSSTLAPNGGNDADLMPGSYVTTPFGTFSLVDHGLNSSFFPLQWEWNATQITSIGLFLQPTTSISYNGRGPATAWLTAGVLDDANIQVGMYTGSGFETHINDGDGTGLWLAVPEPSASGLLTLGGALLASRRRR